MFFVTRAKRFAAACRVRPRTGSKGHSRLGILLSILALSLTASAIAFKAAPQSPQPSTVEFGYSYHNDVSPPLRNLAASSPNPILNSTLPLPTHRASSLATALLNLLVPEVIPPPILSFDGLPFPICQCIPPGDNGAVGETQYVQVIRGAFEIFNKSTGQSAAGPISLDFLWSGLGQPCQSNAAGDAIVLYDQLAGRWVITESAGMGIPTDQCIAVSTTSDAAGSWNRYAFHLGPNFFDDPKIAIWPDGYYMSFNVFNSSGTTFLGPQPFAFDRTKMLAGLPASFLTTGVTGGPTESPYLPADIDGAILPPAGAPNSFVEFPANGTYRIFHFHADFTTPANSTFTLFASPPAGAFTPLCPGTRNCVPEPGGSLLDGITGRLMFRLAYRNFGTAAVPNESLVGNYSVSSNGVAGIRWFELKSVDSGPISVAQESTYQPDTTWRW